ncbi:beta-hydroxyacyl-ACP dehydratase [Flavobacterium sp. 17A]|uniref:Beta-hydroxyacyl-ACP dehydratase n=1 Tax=Flavobacterium potami TaxID=2872310 RepID=A0A9X1HBQ3_9FLAO|nr:3-hydroxyacyl-ACP dehydratase FabZ family protein [Flavobacterium potami]MBZ4035539.1 beta-hydroxyacyl-ACP dehydratase [Flavobacterium potami]
MNQKIEDLIPHRAPFLFVDEIISYTAETIIGLKTFTQEDAWLQGSFPDFNFVPGTILIEAMAQCGGAGVKLLGLAEGVFGLVSLDNIEFFAGVEFEKLVKFLVKNIRISEKIIKQSGEAFSDDKLIVKGEWLCVKLQ